MDKADVKKIVTDEIDKFLKDSLDKEVKKLIHSNNSQSRSEMIKTIKNALEDLFKALWFRHQLWSDSIK
jgi:hypothetical protein